MVVADVPQHLSPAIVFRRNLLPAPFLKLHDEAVKAQIAHEKTFNPFYGDASTWTHSKNGPVSLNLSIVAFEHPYWFAMSFPLLNPYGLRS